MTGAPGKLYSFSGICWGRAGALLALQGNAFYFHLDICAVYQIWHKSLCGIIAFEQRNDISAGGLCLFWVSPKWTRGHIDFLTCNAQECMAT